jgi:import inner membrane translocase subunit TIM54
LEAGEIEPTKDQTANPPPTEQEMHDERIRKEKTWRREEQGFRLVRPGSGMTWHEAFQGALRIYEPALPPRPPASDDSI